MAPTHQPVHTDNVMQTESSSPIQAAMVHRNNWRQIPPANDASLHETVSVIIPYYQAKGKLDLVLLALQHQTYPRDLLEIIVVDDGSDPPLAQDDVPENVRVIHQERDGFGVARARNAGARAASGSILVFVDGDMVLRPDAVKAHARWHHRASNLYTTLGDLRFVDEDATDLDEIKKIPRDNAHHLMGFLKSSNYLTNDADDTWAKLPGPNFAIRRDSFHHIGGYLESFRHWGLEDTHLTYKAYAWGLVIVPIMDTCGWHLGTPTNDQHHLSSALMEQYIPHRGFRKTNQKRIFLVPEYVVSIKSTDPATILLLVLDALDGPPHDLAVRVDLSGVKAIDHIDWTTYIGHRFAYDQRVTFGPIDDALLDYPESSFHVSVSTEVSLKRNFVKRLRRMLGNDDVLTMTGYHCNARIIRSWLAHRTKQHYYASHTNNSKVLRAVSLIDRKPRRALTPSEYPPKSLSVRVIDNMRLVRSSESSWHAIRWAAARTKHHIGRWLKKL